MIFTSDRSQGFAEPLQVWLRDVVFGQIPVTDISQNDFEISLFVLLLFETFLGKVLPSVKSLLTAQLPVFRESATKSVLNAPIPVLLNGFKPESANVFQQFRI